MCLSVRVESVSPEALKTCGNWLFWGGESTCEVYCSFLGRGGGSFVVAAKSVPHPPPLSYLYAEDI